MERLSNPSETAMSERKVDPKLLEILVFPMTKRQMRY